MARTHLNTCMPLRCRYIDRLAEEASDAHIYVTPCTAHRLFAAALLVAAKFDADDEGSSSFEAHEFPESSSGVSKQSPAGVSGPGSCRSRCLL